MPLSRLSTVFDFSGLRLHADGSLVLQNTKNTDLRLSKRTVRDIHGDWIAKDAGGLASVPKYRKVLPVLREDKGEGSIEEDDLDTAGTTGADAFQQQSNLKTSRARKRRKFTTDEEYLAPTLALGNASERGSQPQLGIPSSDLLKCIHHYTSVYYDERGLLLNASQQYRKEKKARKLAKLAQSGKTGRTKTRSLSDAQNISSSEEDEIIHNQYGEEESEGDHQDHQEQFSKAPKAPIRRKHHDLADMYKTMDGSALMAIGFLLQEHVGELLCQQTVSE
ncbi:hypothetical protein J3R30DRAFT_2694213 [Lentinula aciculospora]|uniref:Uncharacterized protein n=1 Tax=Lentinula aciculospora TaxID=153920 RepID=A0A9W9ABM7_9AGAR|nr:hypothetical protein J3R30DRAFT_2694213 [Lentinula aciculospora]